MSLKTNGTAGRSIRRHMPTPEVVRDGGDAATTGVTVPVAGWTALGLVELANYCAIRRRIGKGRAERLVAGLATLIAAQSYDIRAQLAAHNRVEFALEVRDKATLDRLVSTIQALFSDNIDIDGEQVALDVRSAIAFAAHGTIEDVRLAEEVEAAIVEAQVGEPAVMCDVSVRGAIADRSTLLHELPGAIGRDELFLQYQPKVDVRGQRIASAEALVRWQHPVRGLILPGEFIGLAEETRAIHHLTLWTLDQAIVDQRRLAAAGQDITIFVNISAVVLADGQFVEAACRRVRETEARIGFEITETAVIRDPDIAIRHLQYFADHGIDIAIDDYGAGLSSLAYLKRLPASELKIDKMFVMQLTSSNRDPLIVRSTIDLAHALDMKVTAEGVETQAALALLSVMGCDMAQGYLLSRPLSYDAFLLFLTRGFDEMVDHSDRRALHRPASFWGTG